MGCKRFLRIGRMRIGAKLAALLLVIALPCPLMAEIVTLTNGMQIEGDVYRKSTLGSDAQQIGSGSNVQVSKILMIDDSLRRTYVSTNQLRTMPEPSDPSGGEKIRIRKRVATSGRRIGSLGTIRGITPFDQLGNRIFTIDSQLGRLDIVQGITEVTPVYTKVQGLLTSTQQPHIWDMRLSTSSIPREVLSTILHHELDATNPDERLRIVRLYIQSDRYRDALVELQAAIKDFPELEHLKKQVVQLQQQSTERLLSEIELRKEGGQYALAYNMLDGFPQNVSTESRLKVRDMLKEYQDTVQQRDQILQKLKAQLEALNDPALAKDLETAINEIKTGINFSTIARMADFQRLADTTTLSSDEKLALALSGWLLGSGEGIQNLAVATSLYEVRDAVVAYMRASTQPERDHWVTQITEELEGGSPSNVAKILANMKPPIETPIPAEGVPGMFNLSVEYAKGSPPAEYLLQLPPEYDPHRRYPCIVTLNGAGSSAEQQVDWWSGGYDSKLGMRRGQATRRNRFCRFPTTSTTVQQFCDAERVSLPSFLYGGALYYWRRH